MKLILEILILFNIYKIEKETNPNLNVEKEKINLLNNERDNTLSKLTQIFEMLKKKENENESKFQNQKKKKELYYIILNEIKKNKF